jgi:nucleotide-binding universal stress UspA family protein
MPGILLATHGGESADGAVRVAASLAKRLGAPLTAVCVIEPRVTIDAGAGVPYMGIPDDAREIERELLAATGTQLTRYGIATSVRLLLGSAATEIASAARTINAELIVLGIGPHGLLDRALGHETALQLVQIASTPVLAVATDAVTAPRHVLAAVDFSPTSFLSVRTVARWLDIGDTLHLVHAVQPPRDADRARADETTVSASLAKALNAIVLDLPLREGVTVRTTVAVGEPAQILLDLADREDADLIALGSHGYGIWKRLTLGSVASKVMRVSTRSTLVTPISCLGALQRVEAAGAERPEAWTGDAAASIARGAR